MSVNNSYTGNRKRLFDLKKKLGNYRALTEHLGISNVSYVNEYVKHGKIPSNPEIQRKLGIRRSTLEYTRKRNSILNEIAQAAGWGSWSEFSTAALNQKVEIPKRSDQ